MSPPSLSGKKTAPARVVEESRAPTAWAQSTVARPLDGGTLTDEGAYDGAVTFLRRTWSATIALLSIAAVREEEEGVRMS